ncbi:MULTISPECIES: peptidase M56 [Clostridium]|uniref:Peptidase M56 n=1 Tax=Clostridium cibarium TaxID=2762247 RepID=A0ABR8PX69_9CLOT|nr:MULTISPECIES: peptidase M56 [Clostridium]MBD7912778.1 peptidase M56 [Clostridium cibarium]
MNVIKKIFLTVNIFAITFCFLGATLKSTSNLQEQHSTKLYRNNFFNVSLEYNSEWKPNPNYTEKYEGKDGFFQVSAYNGENLKIDEIAKIESSHSLKPYGSNPKITELVIQGQEARLIMPSNDQSQAFNNQAELLVKYPKEIKVDDNIYYYFILWADKYNIQEISKTLKFLS